MSAGQKYSAFLTNVWKPLTYLLDIYFGSDEERFRPYAYGTYRYVDNFEEGNARAALLEGFDRSQAKSRLVYRCRIWGIQKIPQKDSGLTASQYTALCEQAKTRIIRRLDRNDGWLRCSVEHIDSLGRLIVKLYDAKTGLLINPVLLSEAFVPIFDVYRERGTRSTGGRWQPNIGRLRSDFFPGEKNGAKDEFSRTPKRY